MKELERSWEHPKELIPWDKNPRINDKAVAAVADSIEKFGFTSPIIIDQNNVICCGHTRHKAAMMLNLKQVPTLRIQMTEAEFVQLNLSDNKTAEIAKWDNNLLKASMELLDDLQSIEIPGFDDKELDKIFGFDTTQKSSTKDAAEFGDAGKVELDEMPAPGDEDMARTKTMKFEFTSSQAKRINSKLKAIKKEHNLESLAEALIKALDSFKGTGKIIKNGKVKEL